MKFEYREDLLEKDVEKVLENGNKLIDLLGYENFVELKKLPLNDIVKTISNNQYMLNMYNCDRKLMLEHQFIEHQKYCFNDTFIKENNCLYVNKKSLTELIKTVFVDIDFIISKFKLFFIEIDFNSNEVLYTDIEQFKCILEDIDFIEDISLMDTIINADETSSKLIIKLDNDFSFI